MVNLIGFAMWAYREVANKHAYFSGFRGGGKVGASFTETSRLVFGGRLC